MNPIRNIVYYVFNRRPHGHRVPELSTIIYLIDYDFYEKFQKQVAPMFFVKGKTPLCIELQEHMEAAKKDYDHFRFCKKNFFCIKNGFDRNQFTQEEMVFLNRTFRTTRFAKEVCMRRLKANFVWRQTKKGRPLYYAKQEEEIGESSCN